MQFKERWGEIFNVRSADALEPDWTDLEVLYNLVKENKPNKIVEFGSGCSTVVMATALRENKGGRLTSLDNERMWAYETRSLLNPDLDSYAMVGFVDCEQTIHNGTPVFEYLGYLTGPIDMLYLDGPKLTDDCRVTVNPILLENKFSKDFVMVVDGRKETVRFLWENFERNYAIENLTHGNGMTIFRLEG